MAATLFRLALSNKVAKRVGRPSTGSLVLVLERGNERFDRPHIAEVAQRIGRLSADSPVLVFERGNERFDRSRVAEHMELGELPERLGCRFAHGTVPVSERLRKDPYILTVP